MKLNNIYFFN